MSSCLYECNVMHHRFAPKTHRFAYRIFLCAIDLDELPDLHRRLRLFSVNRPNFYSFREDDYLPTGEPRHNASAPAASSPPPDQGPGLKSRVTAFAGAHGIDLTGGRVVLLTLPRILGYLFNPVSFYFCFDRTGAPVCAIAEVTNTFREMKPFLLGPETRDGLPAPEGPTPAFRRRVPKHFYVSPFSDVDLQFDFTLRVPDDRLSVQIDDYDGSARTLTSTLTGRRTPLTSPRLAGFTLKYPLLTLRIIALIHWHAFRLYLKKIRWFRKDARADLQQDLYRPHPSIAHRPES